MANKDLQRASHRSKGQMANHVANYDVWWYEEANGITIVANHNDDSKSLLYRIPWASIKAALKRKEKP